MFLRFGTVVGLRYQTGYPACPALTQPDFGSFQSAHAGNLRHPGHATIAR